MICIQNLQLKIKIFKKKKKKKEMDLSMRRWEHSPLENELPRSVRAKLIEGGEEHMWNAWSVKAGRIKIKYAALFLVNLWSIFLWDEIWEEALTVTKMMIEANHVIAAEREREEMEQVRLLEYEIKLEDGSGKISLSF